MTAEPGVVVQSRAFTSAALQVQSLVQAASWEAHAFSTHGQHVFSPDVSPCVAPLGVHMVTPLDELVIPLELFETPLELEAPLELETPLELFETPLELLTPEDDPPEVLASSPPPRPSTTRRSGVRPPHAAARPSPASISANAAFPL
jgi:hypothetical protein